MSENRLTTAGQTASGDAASTGPEDTDLIQLNTKVAKAGIEPATPGFSILCSTN